MNKKVMRPSISGYVVFGIIAGVPGIVLGYRCIVTGHDCVVFLADLFALMFAMIWIWSHEVVIDDNILTSRDLFHGHQSVQRDHIRKVTFSSGIRTFEDRFRPWLRIEIQTTEGGRPIIINRKIFKIEDLKFLREYLGSRR
jgi:hypothetical protein